MSKIMLILRGLPGAGKSTLASFLSRHILPSTVIGLDHFRVVDGIYAFDPDREREVVSGYNEAVRLAVERGDPFVVLDNVHSRFWEYAETACLGKRYGYKVFVLEVQSPLETCLTRTVHPISPEKVREIAERWEMVSDEVGHDQ